jgi:tRNA (guanine37-N1)-methyltransferase
MRIDVVSIFPDYFAPLKLSLVGKAIESGLVDLNVHDLRAWTRDRHRTVDDTPYGGGAGMVMRPEPWGEALDELVGEPPVRTRLIVLSPSGRVFDQRLAAELKDESRLILACGRYEGIDARVVEHARTRMQVEEVSIGDYVLSGGEAAALVIIESIVRLIPGVVGNPQSLAEESHSPGQDGLLEYPVFTKPSSWRGLDVPSVLFSGHHAEIAAWRRDQAVVRTGQRRPDLLPPHLRELVINRAAPADTGELITLQRAAYLSEARVTGSLELSPLTETPDRLRASLVDGVVLVARRAGRLIASVRAEVATDGAWLIGRLVVAPDLQGRGIGSRLMSEIESCAPRSCSRMRLTATAVAETLSFFGRRGYVELSRSAPDAGVQTAVMEKILP